MNLRPDETELVGQWIFDGQRMHGDETCQRIHHLTKHVLRELGVSEQWGGWETLFEDPSDGRLWERTYPQGHLQGGGPPMLVLISEDQAIAKYGSDVVSSEQDRHVRK